MTILLQQRAERSETGRQLAAVERNGTAILRTFNELDRTSDSSYFNTTAPGIFH